MEVVEDFASEEEGNMSLEYYAASSNASTPPPTQSGSKDCVLAQRPVEVECVKCGHCNLVAGNVGEHKFIGRKDDSVYMTWDDLWVTVPAGKNGSHPILEGCTGYAEPGRVLAIMGPSGSGKTTLLDALSGRLASNTRQSGEILVNGRRQSLAFGTSAYVTQEDVLLTTLTVREAIFFSAQLQLPDTMSKSEKWERAESVIRDMGLHDVMDTRIGNEAARGISGGQKRRVSICVEILTQPWLLFLDEPTSGLDSAAAFHVMKHLASLAYHQGRTVIVSIHQPSSEVFDLFDNLCLLTSGQTIYFGPTAEAIPFFSKNGFPCPTLKNPADHYLRTINKDFDQGFDDDDEEATPDTTISTTEAVSVLVTSYKSSDHQKHAIKRVTEINKMKGTKLKKGNQSGFFNQSVVLTRRSMVNMSRDIGYYWLRFFIFVVIAVSLGSIFYQLDDSYASILDRGSVLLFVGGFLTFMTIGGFPSFVEDMKVFERERLNGHYGVASYVVGHTCSSAPFLALVCVIPAVIAYYMAGLQKSIDHFICFTLVLYACMILVESLMMMVASLIPDYNMGIITGAGIQGLMMLTGGYFRLPDDIPKPVWKYPVYYMTFHKYADQGFYKNEFLGLSFPNRNGSFPSIITGEQILSIYYEMEMHSKWVDVGILFGMVVVYRLLFFIIIKIKEKAKPTMKVAKP